MKSNPRNWENSTMFVQDIKSPGLNVTAELTEEEVDSFKQICKMFISSHLHDKNIDEYFAQMSPQVIMTSKIDPAMNIQPTNENVASECSKPLIHSIPNLQSNAIIETDQNSNVVSKAKPSTEHMRNPPNLTIPVKSKSLTDSIQIDQLSTLIKTKAIDFIFRTMERISYEMDIVGLLTRQLKAYDSKLEMISFGSATYGFCGRNTDLNLLASTGTNYNKNHLSIHLD